MISTETLKRLAIAAGIIAAIWLLLPATRPMQAATPPEPPPLGAWEVRVRFAGAAGYTRIYMPHPEALRLFEAEAGSFDGYETFIEGRLADGSTLWFQRDRRILIGGQGVVDIQLMGRVRIQQPETEEGKKYENVD
jgi:hypothetical protein